MGALSKLLDKVGSGDISVEEALPEFKKVLILHDPTRPAKPNLRQYAERVQEDKDDTDTFTEVGSAYLAGVIDKAQYDAFYTAVNDMVKEGGSADGNDEQRG
jgi:hypothetical protein